MEKAREFQKKSFSASLTRLKPLTVCITTNWKILKEMGIADHLTCSWKTDMQVKKQYLEPEMGWLFKIGKVVRQGCILSPCLFNLYEDCIMRNARLAESQSGIKIARININNLSLYRWHHWNGRKWRGTKEPLDENERGEWKSWLKIRHSNN